MDKDSLYQKMIDMVPFKSEGSFRSIVKKKLKEYQKQIIELDKKDRPEKWEEAINRIKQLCSGINRAIDREYQGMRHSAYTSIKNQLDGYSRNSKVVIEGLAYSKNIKTICANTVSYRMRQVGLEKQQSLARKDLFHIPMDKKGIVETQRFSVPGYPCLYLSSRVYGCWEEMGRPDFGTIMVSKFVSQTDFEVLDLRIPPKKLWDSDMVSCALFFPLVIASMVQVKNSKDSYKPEYLIPQLITEWVISYNRKHKGEKEIIGILFTSTRKNKEDFDFPDDYYDNYAIPVLEPLTSKNYCKTLSKIFKLTNPTYYDLEVLKQGENIDMGSYDALDKRAEYYRVSHFGMMEQYLEKKDIDSVNK